MGVQQRLLDRRLGARALPARLRPRCEELLRVRVLLHRLLEQRHHALLSARQLLGGLRLVRLALGLARWLRLEPCELDERLLHLLGEAGVEEAANVRRGLVLALPPVRHDRRRRVEVVLPHLLRHD
eukprot:7378944-Prymnesium_polylepis.1